MVPMVCNAFHCSLPHIESNVKLKLIAGLGAKSGIFDKPSIVKPLCEAQFLKQFHIVWMLKGWFKEERSVKSGVEVGLNMLPRRVGGWVQKRGHIRMLHTTPKTRYCLSQDVAPPAPSMGKIAQIAKIIAACLPLWSSSHRFDLPLCPRSHLLWLALLGWCETCDANSGSSRKKFQFMHDALP